MNWKVSVAWGAVAGVGGLAVLIAATPTTAGSPIAGGPDAAVPHLTPTTGKTGGFTNTPDRRDQRGDAAGDQEGVGVACHYENLQLGKGDAASQKAIDFPFYAETADDFVLTDPDDPDGLNGCLLDRVVFGVRHDPAGTSPDDWSGVKITIYQDRGNVCVEQELDPACERNPDKGPAGFPLPLPDERQHLPCCRGPSEEAIVCELKIPMTNVDVDPIGDDYEITVSGLDQFDCLLEKNKKYWIAPAPVMPFAFGQTYLLTSKNSVDHEAQLIFPELGIVSWSRIQSQLGILGSDLYLEIWAIKPSSPPAGGGCCPWDCGDGDGMVGIVDFLAQLAQWDMVDTPCDFDGGGVGIVDFLKLLANWGNCP